MPGFPIRTPSDLSSVDSSPRLIAASYVLHRLLMPRHPPCALKNLSTKMLASTVQFSNNHQNTDPYLRTLADLARSVVCCWTSAVFATQETNTQPRVFSQDPTACRHTTQATRPDPFPDTEASCTRHPTALPISSACTSSST
jgi:hypothetical protein